MKQTINAQRIKQERLQRAWSQSHLATLADVSLRTIQRIEASGSASYESLQALAAVFELPTAALLPEQHNARSRRSRFIPGFMTGALVLGMLFTFVPAMAEQIMMHIKVDSPSLSEAVDAHLLGASGDASEVRIDDVLRLEVTPTLEAQGQVRLRLRVHLFDAAKQAFVLSATPELVTANATEAVVQLTLAEGDVHITLRPETTTSSAREAIGAAD